MNSQAPSAVGSRFASCRRWQALAILGAWLAVTGWCLAVATTQEVMPRVARQCAASTVDTGDADFYRAIVRKVHAGQDYYQAVSVELRERGYVPHSVFNWRPPLYAWLFGKLPDPIIAQLLLGLLALVMVVLAFQAVRQAGGPGRALAAVLLLIGPVAWWTFAEVSLFSELWAGILIALSVSAFALDRRSLAWWAALLAIAFRELALPYYLLAAFYVWRRGQRREQFRWLLGLGVYTAYMSWHAVRASSYLHGGDVVHGARWVQFGGTAFVLLTAQMNVFLILAPSLLTAFYLPLALLGLAAWRGRVRGLATLTAWGFVAAFTVIGLNPQNAYWGLLYGPLLPLGLVWAPTALADLWRAIVTPKGEAGDREGLRPRDLPWHLRATLEPLTDHAGG